MHHLHLGTKDCCIAAAGGGGWSLYIAAAHVEKESAIKAGIERSVKTKDSSPSLHFPHTTGAEMSDILICNHPHRTGVLEFVEKKKEEEWKRICAEGETGKTMKK